jgi:hypothetical protein
VAIFKGESENQMIRKPAYSFLRAQTNPPLFKLFATAVVLFTATSAFCQPLPDALNIKPGCAGATANLEVPLALREQLRPGSRMSVSLRVLGAEGKLPCKILAPSVQILSIDGATVSRSNDVQCPDPFRATMTFLVTCEEWKKIRLAASLDKSHEVCFFLFSDKKNGGLLEEQDLCDCRIRWTSSETLSGCVAPPKGSKSSKARSSGPQFGTMKSGDTMFRINESGHWKKE